MINKRDSKGRISGSQSLYDWCIENNRNDILELWDYDKNDITPKDISFSSSKDYYFKCSKGIHDSELKKITYLTNSMKFKCIQCSSFAQHVIDMFGKSMLERVWCTDNNDDPWKITFKSNKQIVLLSYKTQRPYKTSPADFWCIKDIYEYEGNGNIKYNDILGNKYPQCIPVWSSANFLTPFDYSYGMSDMCIWKCENKIHREYIRNVNESVSANFKCPICSQMKRTSELQDKVFDYLTNDLRYTTNTEYNCTIIPINPLTNRKLPFDNEIVDLKLIIEVHGIQHYEETGWHIIRAKASGRTPMEEFEYRKQVDEFKKNYALENGYHYLEIPYWTKDDESYKELINNKIKEILEEVA